MGTGAGGGSSWRAAAQPPDRTDTDPVTASLDTGDPGLLAAGEAAFPGFHLRAVTRTASTQDLALAAARGGAGAGWCVVAEEQTAGRGRQGRTWAASPGQALLVSLLLPATPTGGWPALAAGLAVAEAVEAVSPSPPLPRLLLKWPNDVLARRRDGSLGKLAGILVEAASGPGGLIAVGVGMNVAVDSFPEGAAGVSLTDLMTPHPPPRREALLAALLTATARWWRLLASGSVAAVATAWTGRAAGLGEAVTADAPQGRIEGVARGLDGDGALLVQTSGGVVRLFAGDVHLMPRHAGP